MINLSGTIQAQYANSNIMMAWLALINQSIDPSQGPGGATVPYLTMLKTSVWGAVSTTQPEAGASGVTYHYGLDVWGRIVGINRNVFIPPTATNFMGFAEAQTGGPVYKWTPMWDGIAGTVAVINATVSGTALTVNSVTSGTVAVGQTLCSSTTGAPYITAAGLTVGIISGAGAAWTLSGTPTATITGISVLANRLYSAWDGTTYTTTPMLVLTNTQLQQAILAKAYSNISSASSYALNIAIRKLFGPRVCVYDLGGMGMQVNFEAAATTDQQNLINYGNVLPHASGVAVSIATATIH